MIYSSTQKGIKFLIRLTFFLLMYFGGLAIIPLTAQRLPASKIPPAVLSAFEKTKPGQRVSWIKNTVNYEGRFYDGRHKMVYLYTPKGNLLLKKIAISRDKLPPLVKTAFESQFRDYTLQTAYKVLTASNIRYCEINCTHSEDKITLKYSLGGRLLSQHQKSTAKTPVTSTPTVPILLKTEPKSNNVLEKEPTTAPPAKIKPEINQSEDIPEEPLPDEEWNEEELEELDDSFFEEDDLGEDLEEWDEDDLDEEWDDLEEEW